MATKVTKGRCPDYANQTMTLAILAQGSDTVLASYSVAIGAKGAFSASVTEALSGWYDAMLLDDLDQPATDRESLYYPSDTADTYYIGDPQVVANKTKLIGTGGALQAGSVASDGTIESITIGDDYLADNTRAFEWTIPLPTGFVVAECTCWFGGRALGDVVGSWRVEGTVTDAGGGNCKISFDLPKTATIDCEPGRYDWTAAIHHDGVEITKVRKGKVNQTQLLPKYTNE